MRNAIIGILSLAAVAAPTLALAGGDGAAAGAVTGAVTGGIIGGPVGAAVGAGVGGVAGGAASGPDRGYRDRRDGVYVAPDATGSTGCASRTVTTENSYGESRTVRTDTCD